MKYSEYSAVIVGSGASGLYAALKIAQQANVPDGILLITKSELGESLTIEQLLNEDEFNETIKTLVTQSGRK